MKNILYTLPSLACTMVTCYYSIIDEWDGVAPMIRGLGHAGIYTMFLVAHLKGFTAGTATVASMTLTLFFALEYYDTFRYVFLVSAIGLFGDEKLYTSALLCTGLNIVYYTHIYKDFGFVDLYAYCGHITLLSAVGSVKTSFTFILSALLCLVAFLPLDQLIGFWICSVLNYVFYVSQHAGLPTIKKNKMLWDQPNGKLKTLSVLSYCLILILNGMYLCDTESLLLHFGHVGGIAAVCLTLLPQADASLFGYVKLVVSSAAMFDCLFSTSLLIFEFENMENALQLCLGTRAILAGILSNVLFFTVNHNQLETLPESDDAIQTNNMACSVVKIYFRCTCCCFYISFMFYNSLFEDDIFTRLAFTTHYCLILGALCLEIILGDWYPYLNFVRILIFSQILGSIFTGQYQFLLYFIVLLISLPYEDIILNQ